MEDFTCMAGAARSIVATRTLPASQDAVFDAFVEPDMITKCWGPPDMPMTTCMIDPVPGGEFRYGWAMPDGTALQVSGMFAEVDPARIVHSELYDPDWTGGTTLVTTDITPTPGGCTVRMEIVYPTTDIRDGILTSAMPARLQAGFDRMAALLA